MALPTLSPEQRQQALDKAVAARRARSELLEHVKNGTTTVGEALQRAEDDEIVRRTKVAQLLKALPGYGPAKVDDLLEQAHIPPGHVPRPGATSEKDQLQHLDVAACRSRSRVSVTRVGKQRRQR